ncbi:MAG: hypothetical protein K9N23_14190 [Akkermansiaceae bacterium]|nr:hypothetical protein [Akkermansiaceae bacterium]
MAAPKPFIGFAVADQDRQAGSPSSGDRQDACLPAEEAIRRHLRPELLNRLTKVVHFKPLGIGTAREIFGKLMDDFNKRLADRGVTVELDNGAEELILREGFSEEYGARNLERVMDQLLGSMIAEVLLSGILIAGQVVRVVAKGKTLLLNSER